MIEDLQKLFAEVADMDPRSRSRYFDDHRVPSDVRAEVESLLRFDDSRPVSIERIVSDVATQFLESVPEKFCGPYELIQILGAGGMGSVYLAQRKDGEVELSVAVKLIHGIRPTKVLYDRFLRERQILASLNHPGITRLLDVGHSRSGLPYLVMEYVDGTPIDLHCAGLTFEAKVSLFLSVCDAVAYLHRNLVVHRDLKPSNVLVDKAGAPKLLDFGVAKILDESSPNSITKEKILTPAYASPEQVKGSAITTSTDIYSLGALLYSLLAGHSPHSVCGDRNVEEAICTVDPALLSRVDPSLPEDLSYVVRKALRKEPSERYPTVDSFADDLCAVLEGRPVKVLSNDLSYRVRKFVRRQWLPISTVAAVILSLGLGLVAVNRERAVAQQHFNQLRQLSSRVLKLDDQIRGLPASTAVREQLASMSVEYLDGLSRQAPGDLDLRLEMARGYMTIAQVQGVPVTPSLGHLEKAEESLAKGANLVQSILSVAPSRLDALVVGAQIEQDRTIIASTQQDWARAQAHADQSSAYVEKIAHSPSANDEQKLDAARNLMNIGQARMNMHRYQDASRDLHRALDIAKGSHPSASMAAQALSALANAQRQSGDLEDALASITEARALIEKSTFPNEMLRASALYAVLWRQGLILGDDESISLDRAQDAIPPLEQAFDIVDRQSAKDPDDFSFRDRVATAGLALGDVLRHSDPLRALAVYDRALSRIREVSNASVRRRETKILAHSSYPLRALHRDAEARQRIDRSFSLLRTLGAAPADVGSLGGEWDHVYRALADFQAASGDANQARATLLDLEIKLMEQHPSPESDLRHAFDLSRLYDSISAIDSHLGRSAEAQKYEAMRENLWQAWSKRLPGNSFVQRQLAKKALPSSKRPA